jgi:hypothetical protein
MRRLLALAIAAAAVPAFAWADPNSATLTLTGTVTQACSLSGVAGTGTFTIGGGDLINPATGALANGLTTDGAQSITGSWCNGASTITVTASPLVQAGFVGAPPSSFTKAVNYTATATGWGPTATAVTTTADNTGSPTSNSASNTVGTATAATINVDLTNFTAPGGSTQKLVAGTYTGQVVITLATSP